MKEGRDPAMALSSKVIGSLLGAVLLVPTAGAPAEAATVPTASALAAGAPVSHCSSRLARPGWVKVKARRVESPKGKAVGRVVLFKGRRHTSCLVALVDPAYGKATLSLRYDLVDADGNGTQNMAAMPTQPMPVFSISTPQAHAGDTVRYRATISPSAKVSGTRSLGLVL